MLKKFLKKQADRCNMYYVYYNDTQQWVLAKEEVNANRLSTVLYHLVEGSVIGASLLEPFMPETAQKIVSSLNTEIRSFDQLKQFGLYKNGCKVVEKPEILFARLDMKEVIEKAQAMFEARKAPESLEQVLEEGIDIYPEDQRFLLWQF